MNKIFKVMMPVLLLVSVLAATEGQADQVIFDDLIVGGSTCVGSACVEGQAFGFDTIQVVSPTPSILFEDTSTSASFPSNDWRIGASDGDSGSAATFYIEDVTGNSKAVQIESAAGGGVALGTGSTLTTGAVSVGAIGNERRITNVADGVDSSDAVNMSQFTAFQTAMNDSIAAGTFIDDIQDGLDDLRINQAQLDRRLDSISSELKEVAASAAAFSAVQANPKAEGNTQLSLGLGNYRSKGSVAAGLYRFAASDQIMYNLGVAASMNGGKVMSRAGMTFGW